MTFTRLANYGEEDQFYLRNHHEAIISEEVFEKAQEIRMKRSIPRGLHASNDGNVKRQKYSRKYAFSCMLECGFCGGTLTRRKWHSSSQYKKDIWQCVTSTKKGKMNCPHSKGIPEEAIERAFVESYRQLCNGNKNIVEDFLKKLDETLSESSLEKKFKKIQKQISALDKKKNNLVDMRLEEKIDKETYEVKYMEISLKIDELLKEKVSLENSSDNEHYTKKHLTEFRKTLHNNQILDEFDRYVFESIVEKVILGGVEEDGTIDPHKLVFIYKTGLTDKQDGIKFKPKRKNAKSSNDSKSESLDLCSQASDEGTEMCSHACDHTH